MEGKNRVVIYPSYNVENNNINSIDINTMINKEKDN